MPPDARRVAEKHAKIGAMLRKQGEADAVHALQRSLRLNPASSQVWKLVGSVQRERQPVRSAAAAIAAFSAAVATAQDGDQAVAARTALATVLAQSGRVGAAVDQLIAVRRTAAAESAGRSSDGVGAALAAPFERLCRRLMPAQRFAAAQHEARIVAWERTLLATMNSLGVRVIDMSCTPVPALLAARILSSATAPVIRLESLPPVVTAQLRKANAIAKAQLLGDADGRASDSASHGVPTGAVPLAGSFQATRDAGSFQATREAGSFQATREAALRPSGAQLYGSPPGQRSGAHGVVHHASAQGELPIDLVESRADDGALASTRPAAWEALVLADGQEGHGPNLLLADTDTIDLLPSPYLSNVARMKAMLHAVDERAGGGYPAHPVPAHGAAARSHGAPMGGGSRGRHARTRRPACEQVIPQALTVHVALVDSLDLFRLNGVREKACGLDLSALNAHSHRTRVIRLSELRHEMLTPVSTVLRLPLNGPCTVCANAQAACSGPGASDGGQPFECTRCPLANSCTTSAASRKAPPPWAEPGAASVSVGRHATGAAIGDHRRDPLGDGLSSGEAAVELKVRRDGVAHALVLWHTLHLSPSDEISTAPGVDDRSAKQVAYYLWPSLAPAEPDWAAERAEAEAEAAAARAAASNCASELLELAQRAYVDSGRAAASALVRAAALASEVAAADADVGAATAEGQTLLHAELQDESDSVRNAADASEELAHYVEEAAEEARAAAEATAAAVEEAEEAAKAAERAAVTQSEGIATMAMAARSAAEAAAAEAASAAAAAVYAAQRAQAALMPPLVATSDGSAAASDDGTSAGNGDAAVESEEGRCAGEGQGERGEDKSGDEGGNASCRENDAGEGSGRGEVGTGEMHTGEAALGEAALGEMHTGEAALGEAALGEAALGEAALDATPSNEAGSEAVSGAEAAAGVATEVATEDEARVSDASVPVSFGVDCATDGPSPTSIGALEVRRGESITLRLRWKPYEVSLQLSGVRRSVIAPDPSHAPVSWTRRTPGVVAADAGTRSEGGRWANPHSLPRQQSRSAPTAKPTSGGHNDNESSPDGQQLLEGTPDRKVLTDTNGEVALDEERRLLTIPPDVFVVRFKLKVRHGSSMDSLDAESDLPKGTRVQVVQRCTIVGCERARVVMEGTSTPMGWVTSINRAGTANIVPEEEDHVQAAELAMPPTAPAQQGSFSAPASTDDALQASEAGKQPNDTDSQPGAGPAPAPMDAPPPRVLLARSGPEPTRVSGQNFGAAGSARPRLLSDYHFPMVNDRTRNDAFARAIQRAVAWRAPSLTLDIGCGTGLLAMLAARAGAQRVLAIEMSPEMASLAEQVVAINGLEHAVRVVASHSSAVVLDPLPNGTSSGAPSGAPSGALPRSAPSGASTVSADLQTASNDRMSDRDHDNGSVQHGESDQATARTGDGSGTGSGSGTVASSAGVSTDPWQRRADLLSTDPWQRRADLLIFEVLGTDPLCEGLLPALHDGMRTLKRVGTHTHTHTHVQHAHARSLSMCCIYTACTCYMARTWYMACTCSMHL